MNISIAIFLVEQIPDMGESSASIPILPHRAVVELGEAPPRSHA